MYQRLPRSLWKFGPPVFETFLLVAAEFMIAQGGEDGDVGGSPGSGLQVKFGVVGGSLSDVGNVAADDDRAGFFRGDFVDQPFPNLGIGGLRFLGIREAHVSIRDDDGSLGEGERSSEQQRYGELKHYSDCSDDSVAAGSYLYGREV